MSNVKPDAAQLSEAKRRLLDTYLSKSNWSSSVKARLIEPRPSGELAPLSHAQLAIWLHGQMAEDIPFYNETMTIYRHGPLDVDTIQRCFAEIVRRHEVWRTRIKVIDAEPFQTSDPAPETFTIRVQDLRGFPEAQREVAARRLAAEDAHRAFDVAKGPLLRALAVRLEDEEWRIYMTLHQLVFDATTAYRVFLPELATLYEAFSDGRPSPLPEPQIQYADFAYWQRRTQFADKWSAHIAYWRKQLAGTLPVLQWPNSRPRPSKHIAEPFSDLHLGSQSSLN